MFRHASPTLGIDGNQWYLLEGENLMKGRAGFGRTIEEAIKDFEKRHANTFVRLPDHDIPHDITPEQWKPKGETGDE